MSFTYEMNKIMLIDGILFTLPGLSMLLLPSPQTRLKEKVDSKVALPPFKDVRRILGAAYTSMGFMVIMLAGFMTEKGELNNFAKFRSISLVIIFYALVAQMLGKKWKWNGYAVMYLIMYGLLILVYAFFGFIDPMPVY
jgi:hypothetical protein